MQKGNPDDPEMLWQHLLSRDAVKVRTNFERLYHEEKAAVLAHLNRMAEESSWHPEQRKSAQFALTTLQINSENADSGNG